MLIKRSSKNQVVLPKAVLERAGLGPEDFYFDVEYLNHRIVLTPVQIEEKIPPEALDRFEAHVSKREPGDRRFRSIKHLVRALHRKPRR